MSLVEKVNNNQDLKILSHNFQIGMINTHIKGYYAYVRGVIKK